MSLTNQQIIDNAPEGWTHYSELSGYWWLARDEEHQVNFSMYWFDGAWQEQEIESFTRSRSDIEAIARLERENEALKEKLKEGYRHEARLEDRITELNQLKLTRFGDEEYWIFQDDGEDHPESLVCPVTMSASKLRELLACREQLEALKQQVPPKEQSPNRYGLDVPYFRGVINRELNRSLMDFKPDELARVFARLSRTADESVLLEKEFTGRLYEQVEALKAEREQFAAKKQIEVLEWCRDKGNHCRITYSMIERELEKLRTNAGGSNGN